MLVYDYSRFSRNVLDAYYYLKIFRDCRVDFISVTEPIDYTNDFAIMYQFFIIAKNAQDSIDTGRKVMSHKREVAKDTKHCGGIPPLGYYVTETGLLEIEPEEAKLVKLIFQLVLQGRSYKWLANYLNTNGYKTKVGKKFTRNSFIGILRQEKYIGNYVWNRTEHKDELGYRNSHKYKDRSEQTVIEGGCPQIITKKQFFAVQALLDSRAGGKAENKSRRHYMLGGMNLMHCAECGRAMVGTIVYSHGNEYEVYRCPTHKDDKSACSNKDIRADTLNKFVATTVIKHLFKNGDVKTLNRRISELDSTKPLRRRKEQLDNSIEQVLKAIDESFSGTLLRHLKKLEYERDSIVKQLDAKEAVAVIDEYNFRHIRKEAINYLCTDDSPEARALILDTVGDIKVGNDSVIVELRNI